MANYYVDITKGSDGDGSSFNAWNNFLSHRSTPVAGDTVWYIGTGDSNAPAVVTEKITIDNALGHASGSSGSPINIKPVGGQYVKFQNTSSGNEPWRFNSVNWWIFDGGTLKGFEIDCLERTSSGYAFRTEGGNNIQLKNTRVHNGKYFTMVNFQQTQDFLVDGCDVWDNFVGPGSDAAGISFRPDSGTCSGGIIRNCTIWDCGSDCIVNLHTAGQPTWLWHDVVIEDNHLYTTLGAGSEQAIDLKCSVDAICQRNLIHGFRYNDGSVSGSGGGGVAGIISHTYSTGTRASTNIFYDMSGAAIAMTSSNGIVDRNICYGGVYENPAGYSSNDRAWFRFYSSGGSSHVFYNNTVNGRFAGQGHIVSIGANVTVTASNNIFYETGTIYLRSGSVFTASYNCWWNCAQTSVGTGDVNADPLFVNVAGNDYGLQSTSPCRNTATIISPYTDGYLESGPDMGAEEYDPDAGGGGGGGGGTTLGNVVVRTVQVASRTAIGTQDIVDTVLYDANLTPVAVEYYITRAIANATQRDNAAMSWGVATGTSNQGCIGWQMQDGQTTTLTHQRHDDALSVLILQAGSTTREGAAAHSAFIRGGVRLNWTTAPPQAYLLTVVMYAGSGVQAYAAQKDLGNTTNLQTDFTEGGFAPDIVLAGTAHSHLDTAGTNTRVSLGAVRFTGGITQRAIVYRNNSGATDVEAFSRITDDYGVVALTSGGSVQWGGEFVAVTNAFGVITRVAGSSNSPLLYLMLKFTGASTYLGTLTSPTAPGSQVSTAPAFRPQAVRFGFTLSDTIDTTKSDENGEAVAFGIWTEDAQYSHMVADNDGGASSDTFALTDAVALSVFGGDKAAKLAATLSGFDDTGWTLIWSVTESSGRLGWVLAIENTSLDAPVLDALIAGNGQLILNWTDVSEATGYVVKYGLSAGSYPNEVILGDVNTYTLTGLTNGTTYYIIVTATTGSAESPNSNEQSAIPTAPLTIGGSGASAGLADYMIRLYDASGTLVATVTDYLGLSYTKKKNAPGFGSFLISSYSRAANLLVHKGQVEIYRRNRKLGLDWYCDFYGLMMGVRQTGYDPERIQVFVPGQLSMLGWREVAYNADVVNRSLFRNVKGETLLKRLVTYNATSAGTTGDGRKRNATQSGLMNGVAITVETDQARGNTIDTWECADANLLETLKEAAQVVGGDFDLVKTGATTWDFRWFTTRRGTDRTGDVILAPERGNMATLVYVLDRRDEKTVAIVNGSGRGVTRPYVVRTGLDYASNNDVEVSVSASASAGLNASGDAELYRHRARETFEFDVLQTRATYYGKHYCIEGVMSDLVTVNYKGVTLDVEIVGVTVDLAESGKETITPELMIYG